MAEAHVVVVVLLVLADERRRSGERTLAKRFTGGGSRRIARPEGFVPPETGGAARSGRHQC
jgi:hypothetical protein